MNLKRDSKIIIIGGDQRQSFLFNELSNIFPNCHCALIPDINPDLPAPDILRACDLVILPVPASKDSKNVFSNSQIVCPLDYLIDLVEKNTHIIGGYFPKNFAYNCRNNSLNITDLKDYPPFEIMNSISTAEATISLAVSNSTTNLHQENCLITGFGNCASALALRLKAFACNITIAARNPIQLAKATECGYNTIMLSDLYENVNSFSYIFNTVPALIFNKKILSVVKKDVTLIDISSKPGGCDFYACKKYNINAIHALSLPGKFSPKSSALIILKCLEDLYEFKQ